MITETLDKAMHKICANSDSAELVQEQIAKLNSDEVASLSRFTTMIDQLLMDREINSFYNPSKEV